MNSLGRLLAVLAVAATACSRGGAWTPVAADAVEQASRRAQATAARDALATRLLGELSGALANGGPQGAIGVCRERAPALAAQVGAELGVRIGRTSRRLRNPANVAPGWATAHVAGDAADPAFFSGPDQHLGVLFPIPTMPMCVLCHGRADTLSGEVRAALGQHYPQDAATGFAPGDLRGWFWVEVP